MNAEDDCRMTVTRMHLFLDDELGTVEAEEVAIHVEGCDDCEEQFDVETHLRALIRGCCQETAPMTLMARLLQLHCDCGGDDGS